MTLTSCINLVEYIGTTADNRTEVVLLVTVDKAFYDLASQDSSGSGNSLDQSLREMDAKIRSIQSELPAGVAVSSEKVDNASEIGYRYTFIYPPSFMQQQSADSKEVPPIFPVKTADGLVISFPSNDSSDQGSDSQYAKLFLSTAKYQIILSKSFVAKISSATFSNASETIPLEISNMNDVYLLEMPFMDAVMSPTTGTITIK